MSQVVIEHQREEKLLHLLFFLFGFGIMAWVPRFPEVRENLKLENGAFGSLMSTGSIGAFFGLLITGHIIHRIGVSASPYSPFWCSLFRWAAWSTSAPVFSF